MQVLFFLSFRLGPILALVIIATAATAANYKKQTKLVEGTASRALSSMVGVADQAFRAITTVRFVTPELQFLPAEPMGSGPLGQQGSLTCKYTSKGSLSTDPRANRALAQPSGSYPQRFYKRHCGDLECGLQHQLGSQGKSTRLSAFCSQLSGLFNVSQHLTITTWLV